MVGDRLAAAPCTAGCGGRSRRRGTGVNISENRVCYDIKSRYASLSIFLYFPIIFQETLVPVGNPAYTLVNMCSCYSCAGMTGGVRA